MFSSEGYGLQEYYKKTQTELQARREAIHTNHNHPDQPVLDGDVTTMRVKFERFVLRPFGTPLPHLSHRVTAALLCLVDDV